MPKKDKCRDCKKYLYNENSTFSSRNKREQGNCFKKGKNSIFRVFANDPVCRDFGKNTIIPIPKKKKLEEAIFRMK